ncbi:MAG: FKBP-type peptidyl-prolyl cis-trans isomerase [Bacteroidaceae bacterium]|nr:FKBP-type peptidyl-prolyl cis-trans isomerase [Bacteroidaceae bacterium]
MKKILFATFIFVSVCASAQTKGDVQLKNPTDSISYTAGYANSTGLDAFLERQFNISKKDLPEFVEAFKAALKKVGNKKATIELAGATIANQIGTTMVPQLKEQFEGTKLNDDLLYRGLLDGLMQDTAVVNRTAAQKYFRGKVDDIRKAKEEAQKEAGKKWLADNAKKKGVKTLPSGLQYKVITEGTGAIPTKDQTVTVKYEGKTIDGKVFDSSYKRNPQTTDFKPTQVIKGWTEALTMMPVGSVWELYIPENLAYGSQQKPNIPAYSTLIFKVELIGIK